MSMWEGVSRCWPPGTDGCVIWWDAWVVFYSALGAGIAALAVLATVFLGTMTLRLGQAANAASAAAVKIADEEARRQRRRDKKERTLVLVQINAEVLRNREQIVKLYTKVTQPQAVQSFSLNTNFRESLLEDILKIEFPITEKLTDRLHYLDDIVGPTLVRCIGVLGSTAQSLRAQVPQVVTENYKDHLLLLQCSLGVLVEDLGTVRAACSSEIARSQIDAKRIARGSLIGLAKAGSPENPRGDG